MASLRAVSSRKTVKRDTDDSAELFDTYRGTGISGGARSLAFRLRLQAVDRTMTDDEIGALLISLSFLTSYYLALVGLLGSMVIV
jgi:hypothetical protein